MTREVPLAEGVHKKEIDNEEQMPVWNNIKCREEKENFQSVFYSTRVVNIYVKHCLSLLPASFHAATISSGKLGTSCAEKEAGHNLLNVIWEWSWRRVIQWKYISEIINVHARNT